MPARDRTGAGRSTPATCWCSCPGSARSSAMRKSAVRHRLRVERTREVLPLHGDLPIEQQTRALQPDPHGRRRVVLATNVAESSVTLPGVRVVIDSGLAREPRFDPNCGFSRLDIVNISQASADQRAGRAGRVAAGCVLPAVAAIATAGTAAPPRNRAGRTGRRWRWNWRPGAAMRTAFRRCAAVGRAGRGARSAATARRAGRNAASPRSANACWRWARIRAWPRCCWRRAHAEQALACDLAALIEARDPLRSAERCAGRRWQALAAFRRRPRAPAMRNRGALAAIDAASETMAPPLALDDRRRRRVPAHRARRCAAACVSRSHRAPASADPRRYQLANGRMARLFDDSALYGEPWIVASELRFEAKEMR